LAVIRRQAKVAARLTGASSEPVAGPSRGTMETTNTALSKDEKQKVEVVVKGMKTAGTKERGQGGNQHGPTSLSKAQINVVRTMIYITVCFTVCWMPMYISGMVMMTISVKRFY